VHVTDGVDIQLTREFAASADRIYTAFTAPLALATWFGPDGWRVDPESVVVEPRPYGRYRLTLHRSDDPTVSFAIRARVLELIPPRLILIEERTADSQMQLQIDLVPTGEDTCTITLREGPYAPESEAMAIVSWQSAFVRLDRLLRTGVPLGA
jgi:uncharacterized protein YndB with AHSA1/START domain